MNDAVFTRNLKEYSKKIPNGSTLSMGECEALATEFNKMPADNGFRVNLYDLIGLAFALGYRRGYNVGRRR